MRRHSVEGPSTLGIRPSTPRTRRSKVDALFRHANLCAGEGQKMLLKLSGEEVYRLTRMRRQASLHPDLLGLIWGVRGGRHADPAATNRDVQKYGVAIS